MFTIYVNKGTFSTIAEAAEAENEINWWDETDERAVYCTECFAAVELQKHLQLVLGDAAMVRLETTEAALGEGCGLFVGTLHTNAYIKSFAEQALVDMNELTDRHGLEASSSDEAFLIDTISLAGQRHWVLSGSGRTGTLYAVYAFLEKLGFKWYAPGELGSIHPETISVPAEFRCCERPRFHTRGCYSEFINDRNDEFIDWIARNRMNYIHVFEITNPHALKKRGIRIAGGGHDILFKYLDPQGPYPYTRLDDPYPESAEYKGNANEDGMLSYSEAHPEWFALVDGKRKYYRSPDSLKEQFFVGDNHCLTNPDASRELARNVIHALVDGELKYVDDLNYWPLDNGNWCECERCAQSGNYTSQLIGSVHHLRQMICEAMEAGVLRRNVRILFPAYNETLEAPNVPIPESFDYSNCFAIFFPIERCYVHTINDKGCTETNAPVLRHYESWSTNTSGHYKGEMFVGEYYGVRSFAAMPVLLSRMIANDIPYYYETGTRHFYYMHMTSGRWGMLALNNYLYSALLWNSASDSEAIIETYFESYYKEIASLMKAFYEKLEHALSNIKYIKHYQKKDDVKHAFWFKLKDREAPWFALDHMQYDELLETSNSGISMVGTIHELEACRALLDKALLLAETPIVVQRLLEDEMRFDYGQTMVLFYYRYIRTLMLLQEDKHSLAIREFHDCRICAEKLRSTKLPLQNYDYSKYYVNGLEASWVREDYERLFAEMQELMTNA